MPYLLGTEMRYFTPWLEKKRTQNFILPKVLRDVVGQIECPIGDAVIDTLDTCLAPECCEELFTPASPHIESGLNGANIFFNSSGSHHELRKLNSRIQLLLEATRKSKGVYIYANQQGCDGDRLYYDGCAMVMMNGAILAQSSQFSLSDVEVVTATVDLDEVSSSRSAPSTGMQAAQALGAPYARIRIPMSLHEETTIVVPKNGPTPPLAQPRYHSPWEEIALGPGCYLVSIPPLEIVVANIITAKAKLITSGTICEGVALLATLFLCQVESIAVPPR